jgi:hypothetical protein
MFRKFNLFTKLERESGNKEIQVGRIFIFIYFLSMCFCSIVVNISTCLNEQCPIEQWEERGEMWREQGRW